MDEVRIRITVLDPPQDVAYCLQHRKRDDRTHVLRSQGNVAFDFAIRTKDGEGAPDFVGPYVQGPPGERYIAVLIGTLAGDAESPLTNALKVWLRGISPELVDAARKGGTLAIAVAGKDRKGGPACATARVLEDWKVE